MENLIPPEMIWWITAVEIPALGGLLWLVLRTRREVDIDLEQERARTDGLVFDLRDNHSAYKLEVAKTYASISYLKEVEARLTGHLIRIENKLDTRDSHKGDLP